MYKLTCILVSFGLLTSVLSDEKKPFFRKDYTYNKEFDAFYKAHKTKKVFADAISACNAEGAKVLIPTSQAESDFAFRLTKPETSMVWLGIHDIYGEGGYSTLEGVSLDQIYSNWAPGEPNDEGDKGEDCILMLPDTTYIDGTCKTRQYFVCKRKASGLSQNFECDTYDPDYKFTAITNKCYKFHKQPKNWNSAYAVCVAEEANLVVINSDAEAQFLINELAKYPESSLSGKFEKSMILIGFNDLINDGVFLTVDGQTLKESGYEKWGPYQPDSKDDDEHCGSMSRDGTLNDINCRIRAMFVCEKKLNDNILKTSKTVSLMNRDAVSQLPDY